MARASKTTIACRMYWMNKFNSTLSLATTLLEHDFAKATPKAHAKYSKGYEDFALVATILAINVALAIMNIICGRKIRLFLKTAALHHNSLTLQRQMFTLLQLQAACPFLFMQVPCFLAISLLLAGIDTTPLVTNCIDVLLALSPLVNPIITLAFLRDYRNFILIKLGLKKPLNPQRVTDIHTLRRPRLLVGTTNIGLSLDTSSTNARSIKVVAPPDS
ncbi:hypothetical protein TELCIR_13533 [Teladorsagia circumcincta]|uniref:G protein-coupled receptor n=1 Tax=Teladorsagia circumcincta TaxID=45464 RepID=A0A2G9U544_TELCI|nr:hypothetical protein TELCIR_13533 [Teladorsagia circumcincta]